MPRAFPILITLVAACGGAKSPPPAQPTAAAGAGSAERETGATAPPAPGSAPALTHKSPTLTALFASLHEDAGPIAGLPGYSVRHTPDPKYCGGMRAEIERPAGTPSAADAPFVAVLDLQFPAGLDLTADRDGSMQKVRAFIEQTMKVANEAQEYYTAKMKVDGPERYAAVARMAQISFHVAALYARAPLAKDATTTDTIDAFCEALAAQAEPLEERGKQIASRCVEGAAKYPGWWAEVCHP